MLRITFSIGAGRSEQSKMSHGRAASVISFVDGAIAAGVWLSDRAASTGAAGPSAGSSAAGCATAAVLSLTGASIADQRLAEFAGWPGVGSYLSNSALHVPLSRDF
ncbi:MAG: hypothetical protein E6G96_00710 [Alphaproteobacteria bacterium]|nr:MAG: hypothetical protein E6G96_00710 [Alphaproteobacteria bacterium]